MGFHTHHAIIATTWDYKQIDRIYADVQAIIEAKDSDFLRCLTPVQSCGMNAYHTFTFIPDGGKEMHAYSDTGDSIRNAICDYLDSTWQIDGSFVQYVEVEFGVNADGDLISRVIRTNKRQET
jgi:hypothetical protein